MRGGIWISRFTGGTGNDRAPVHGRGFEIGPGLGLGDSAMDARPPTVDRAPGRCPACSSCARWSPTAPDPGPPILQERISTRISPWANKVMALGSAFTRMPRKAALEVFPQVSQMMEGGAPGRGSSATGKSTPQARERAGHPPKARLRPPGRDGPDAGRRSAGRREHPRIPGPAIPPAHRPR